eukprot:1221847-Prymnesium_polylepis.1
MQLVALHVQLEQPHVGLHHLIEPYHRRRDPLRVARLQHLTATRPPKRLGERSEAVAAHEGDVAKREPDRCHIK